MDIISQKLCSIQGRLFELSARKGYESNEFIKAYMNSDVAAKFNSVYDRSQWMGEEYLLCELVQNYQLTKGEVYPRDILFWMGYTYAYWSIFYGEPCNKIIKIAPPKIMAENYAGLHTVSMDMAVQDLNVQYWSHEDNGVRLREEVCKKVIKDELNSRGYTTEYQRFLNDTSTDVLFYLSNEFSRRVYEYQRKQYATRKIYDTYAEYMLDLIDNADISQKNKAEYSFVVKDVLRIGMNKGGITNMQFAFLDSLESRLKKQAQRQ